ncbi:MAG: hypothetical protein QMD09_09170 [Desulfatibacillaceae bacterium]|nr:hypothetical protein [Desulfatibacillaceae bacterium]
MTKTEAKAMYAHWLKGYQLRQRALLDDRIGMKMRGRLIMCGPSSFGQGWPDILRNHQKKGL